MPVVPRVFITVSWPLYRGEEESLYIQMATEVMKNSQIAKSGEELLVKGALGIDEAMDRRHVPNYKMPPFQRLAGRAW